MEILGSSIGGVLVELTPDEVRAIVKIAAGLGQFIDELPEAGRGLTMMDIRQMSTDPQKVAPITFEEMVGLVVRPT